MTSDAAPAFMPIPSQVRRHARARPDQPALIQPDGRAISWQGLDELMDRIAAALQRDGVRRGERGGAGRLSSIAQAAVFLGVLRAGAVVAPLAASVTPQVFAAMVQDAGARLLFVDATASHAGRPVAPGRAASRWMPMRSARRSKAGWRRRRRARPQVDARARDAVQHHLFVGHDRHAQRHRAVARHALDRTCCAAGDYGYGPDAVTMLSTPLYSNTTLVSFLARRSRSAARSC